MTYIVVGGKVDGIAGHLLCFIPAEPSRDCLRRVELLELWLRLPARPKLWPLLSLLRGRFDDDDIKGEEERGWERGRGGKRGEAEKREKRRSGEVSCLGVQ